MDFEKARHCTENKEVMRIASQRFRIPREEKQQCKMLGLWDAVRLYDDSRGVPFKLFLSLRVKFRCLKWCHDNYDSKLKYVDMFDDKYINIDQESKDEPYSFDNNDFSVQKIRHPIKIKRSIMRDVLLSLNENDKHLINSRFLENRTLEDIGKEHNVSYETIRKRINLILEKFKD